MPPARLPDRRPRAVAAGADVEALRAAYLELLKLCLCDLGGTGTTSVWRHTDGSLLSRELTGADLGIRAAGADWPLHGVTMVGIERLDDLQRCLETIVRDGVEGDVIEAGTWRGGAAILMRATLDALGATEREVWVADSFAGFPAPDADRPDRADLAPVDYLAVPLEQVRANFARLGYERGVRFVEGYFEDTLPGLTDARWALVRLDGDTYEATATSLESLYPRLAPGGYVIVDDYGALEECRRAVDEYRARNGIDEPLEEVGWTSVRWRRVDDAPPVPSPVAPRNGRRPARPPARQAEPKIASVGERELARAARDLERELAHVRALLAAAEAEVSALRGSPFRGPRAWLRQRLRR